MLTLRNNILLNTMELNGKILKNDLKQPLLLNPDQIITLPTNRAESESLGIFSASRFQEQCPL